MDGVANMFLSLVSEWGTFILSCVSAVVAVVSALVAYWVYRSQTYPDVIAYVGPIAEPSRLVALFVENIGNAPAYDVDFRVSGGDLPIADDLRADVESSFLVHGIPMLAPRAHRCLYLGLYEEVMDMSPAELAITYRRSRKSRGKMNNNFPIETGSFRMTPIETPLEVEELKNIVEELGKISKG